MARQAVNSTRRLLSNTGMCTTGNTTPLIPRATDDFTGPADETSALLNFLKIMLLSLQGSLQSNRRIGRSPHSTETEQSFDIHPHNPRQVLVCLHCGVWILISMHAKWCPSYTLHAEAEQPPGLYSLNQSAPGVVW